MINRIRAEMEVDFGGDQDEVEPETLQDSWLLDLCVKKPYIAKQTAQVMAHLINRADLVTRVEKMSPDDALLEVKVAYCNYISQSKHPKTCFGICCLCFFGDSRAYWPRGLSSF